jgi:FkbM family methyltransferase
MILSAFVSRVARFFYYRSQFFYRAWRFPIRRLIRFGYALARKMGVSSEVRCDSIGTPICVSLKDLKGFSLWVEGTAQFEKIDYLQRCLETKPQSGPAVFVDCGANYGEFLSLLARTNSIEKWIAVEPNPFVNSCLEKTLASLAGNLQFGQVRFQLHKSAIVPNAGAQDIQLHFNPYYSGGGSIVKSFSTGNTQSVPVSTVSIPQIIESIPKETQAHLAVIKIDVEGFEFELLPTFLDELQKYKLGYVILFETHLKTAEDVSKLRQIVARTSGHKVVYPPKHENLNLSTSEIPLTQYDIAIASWKI